MSVNEVWTPWCLIGLRDTAPLQDIVGVPSPDSVTVQVRVTVDSPAIPVGLVGVMVTEEIVTRCELNEIILYKNSLQNLAEDWQNKIK